MSAASLNQSYNEVYSAIYGCDIGNGFSFISVLEEGKKHPESAFPRMISSLDISIGMPSESYLVPPEGKPIIVFDTKGRSAEKEIRRDPEKAVRAVKTQLSSESLTIPGINKPISPYDVYAAIAHDLVALGNYQRVIDKKPPIYQLVLTYPACFNNFQNGIDILNRMQESIEKVQLDGHNLEVVRRLPEPAAVAIDYLSMLQEKEKKEGKKLTEFTALVYDLGHGTFDVAVVTVRSEGEPYQVWKTDGLSDVGGKNFDQRLLEDVLEQLKEQFDYSPKTTREKEELLRSVIELKHELSGGEKETFTHQNREDGSFMELSVTREHFEEITCDLLNETILKTHQVMNEYLQENATDKSIDCVVLSGGASRMPMVKRALEETMGQGCPVYLFRTSEAVSMGAARYAGRVAQLQTRNSYAFLDDTVSDLNGKIEVVLRSNMTLPAESSPVKLRLPAKKYDVRVYRPKDESASKTTDMKDYDNLVFLHFDIPYEDEYSLVMTVGDDYNITVTLTSEKITLTSSTKQN